MGRSVGGIAVRHCSTVTRRACVYCAGEAAGQRVGCVHWYCHSRAICEDPKTMISASMSSLLTRNNVCFIRHVLEWGGLGAPDRPPLRRLVLAGRDLAERRRQRRADRADDG